MFVPTGSIAPLAVLDERATPTVPWFWKPVKRAKYLREGRTQSQDTSPQVSQTLHSWLWLFGRLFPG